MELSKRMKAVAQMVPAGHITADVGCDHGFVSIYLAKHGICPHVYAADVRPGPLARAKEHIEESGLSASITPILSDGLQKVPIGENGADCMIAAGMGGKLTIRILSDVPDKTAKLSWVILEPQSEVWLVRRWLAQNGFVIADEDMVWEDGKYYPVIKAKNTVRAGLAPMPDTAPDVAEQAKDRLAALEKRMESEGFDDAQQQLAQDWFGPVLLYRKSPVLLSFLEHTIEKDMELLRLMPKAGEGGKQTDRIAQRKKELARRLELERKAAGLFR